MNALFHFGVVIAQGNRLDSLSSGFRGRRAQIDSHDFFVGAVVLATGFSPYDPSQDPLLGYGHNPGVLTLEDVDRVLKGEELESVAQVAK